MEPKSIMVANNDDALLVQQTAKSLAIKLGFSEKELEDIDLITSELATLLIKHNQKSCIEVKPIAVDSDIGLEFTLGTEHPNYIPDEASSGSVPNHQHTLGLGFEQTMRLVDEMVISACGATQSETYVNCKKWLNTKPDNPKPYLEIGILCQPKPGEFENGDSFYIIKNRFGTLISVIDGLGHGESAHKASKAARMYLDAHSEQPLLTLFQGVDRECLNTNGVVMALAHFDTSYSKLTFASLGNIEVRIIGGLKDVRLPAVRGIVGRNDMCPKLTEIPWVEGHSLVLHSDGLSSKWRWHDFTHLNNKPIALVAENIFSKLRLAHDDATLVALKVKKNG